ncbi:MAG: zf-HC2 domain-containing protein [Chloroflexota bacterium]|nr:zf-HC2 domain-containing protein [Chloroflexota bacterium]MDQ5866113.1 zf-HC2 domain-containing protein [Chloroflexota bacterium]
MTGFIEDAVHDEGRLRAYLDGELASGEAAELKAHLEGCAECQSQVDEMRKGAIEVSGLLGMPVHTPDAHAALYSLRKALSDEAVSPGPVTQEAVRELSTAGARSQVRVGDYSRSGWSRIARSGVSAILAAGLVLGLALFWSGLPGRAPVKPPLLGISASPEATLIANEAIANFVPPGKVRHIVVTESSGTSVEGLFPQPTSVSREIWFANGNNHLLMHLTASDDVWAAIPEEVGMSLHGAGPREIWLSDDALYLHFTGDEDVRPVANVVLKYPYDPDYLKMYGPNPDALSKLLDRNPEARVLGNTWIDNHPVVKVVVESRLGQPGATPVPGEVTSEEPSRTRTFWIDAETGQYRRAEAVTRAPRQPGGSLEVFTSTIVIERDELLDASQVQPDYFDFKLPEGANLIERDTKLLSFGLEAGRGDWFEYIDVPGNFSVLMPRHPDWSYDSSGKTTLGAKHAGVTYGVKYVGRELDLTAPGNEGSLRRAFTMSRSEGEVLSEQDITLGAYPGKEYRLRDAEGNYRIWRVYAAQQRVYTVFAIAPNETTEADTIRDFFDSFKLLNP